MKTTLSQSMLMPSSESSDEDKGPSFLQRQGYRNARLSSPQGIHSEDDKTCDVQMIHITSWSVDLILLFLKNEKKIVVVSAKGY